MNKIITAEGFDNKQFKSFNELIRYLCTLHERKTTEHNEFTRKLFEVSLKDEDLLEYKTGVKKRAKIVYGKNTKIRIKSDAKFIEDLVKLGELKIEINTEETK